MVDISQTLVRGNGSWTDLRFNILKGQYWFAASPLSSHCSYSTERTGSKLQSDGGMIQGRGHRLQLLMLGREFQLFLVGYVIVSLCEIFTVGGFPLDRKVRLVHHNLFPLYLYVVS